MEFITYEQEGFVGILTINRPKALNALNSQVLDELNEFSDDKSYQMICPECDDTMFEKGTLS